MCSFLVLIWFYYTQIQNWKLKNEKQVLHICSHSYETHNDSAIYIIRHLTPGRLPDPQCGFQSWPDPAISGVYRFTLSRVSSSLCCFSSTGHFVSQLTNDETNFKIQIFTKLLAVWWKPSHMLCINTVSSAKGFSSTSAKCSLLCVSLIGRIWSINFSCVSRVLSCYCSKLLRCFEKSRFLTYPAPQKILWPPPSLSQALISVSDRTGGMGGHTAINSWWRFQKQYTNGKQ